MKLRKATAAMKAHAATLARSDAMRLVAQWREGPGRALAAAFNAVSRAAGVAAKDWAEACRNLQGHTRRKVGMCPELGVGFMQTLHRLPTEKDAHAFVAERIDPRGKT